MPPRPAPPLRSEPVARPTISVVIPAHNEEASIGAVLDAVALQSAELLEVIVVDNNCTDGTVDVVRARDGALPALQVVSESRPGVIAARNAGFDAAAGDVIARLDADTRPRPGWAAAIRDFFARCDPAIGAGSGPFGQYDMPMQWLHRRLTSATFTSDGSSPRRLDSLYGANMAVRRNTWTSIRPQLLDRSGVFDDLDITLCVADAGQWSAAVPLMEVDTSGRRMLSSVRDYRRFTSYLPATFAAHGMTGHVRAARVHQLTMRALHLLLWVPVRAWDPDARRYRPARLMRRPTARTLPYRA